MRKLKIYLETSLFNFYVDKDRGDAHTDTVQLFEEIAAGKYEAYTSDYVVDELKKAPVSKFAKMMGLLNEDAILVLGMDDEADRLADLYIAQGVIPL